MSLIKHFQDAKARASRQFLNDFDHHSTGLYYNASSQKEAVDWLLETAAPVAVTAAIATGVLPLHPYPVDELHADAGVDGHAAEIDAIAGKLGCLLRRFDRGVQAPEMVALLQFLAAHLLSARAALVMQDQRKNYFYSRGDENALTAKDTPTIFRQFEQFLDHTGRHDELKQARLTICDVIAPDDEPADSAETESEKPWSGVFYWGTSEPTHAPTHAEHWVSEFAHWLTQKGFSPDEFPNIPRVAIDELEAMKARGQKLSSLYVLRGDGDAVRFVCADPRVFDDWGCIWHEWNRFLENDARYEVWQEWRNERADAEIGAAKDAPGLDDGIAELAD